MKLIDLASTLEKPPTKLGAGERSDSYGQCLVCLSSRGRHGKPLRDHALVHSRT